MDEKRKARQVKKSKALETERRRSYDNSGAKVGYYPLLGKNQEYLVWPEEGP